MSGRKNESFGMELSVTEKKNIIYVNMMVECIFEEVCRDGVRVDEVKSHIDKKSREKSVEESVEGEGR